MDDLRQHLLQLAKRHEEIRGFSDDEVEAETVVRPAKLIDLDDARQIAANTDWPRFLKALASLRVQVTTATAAIGTVLVNGGFQWNDKTSTLVAVALTAWGTYLAYLDAQRKIGG